ncbi:MAG: acetolactate synthase small subunit [Planctomycetota bacterium]|jgi:acetolactate synthase-1/3 small subunit
MAKTEHIITGVLRNVPGVLMQIGENFRKLGINIQSLNAAPTDDEDWSHITIVTEGHEAPVAAIQDAMRQHCEVLEFQEVGTDDIIERELALVQVRLGIGQSVEIMQIAELFHAAVLALEKDQITFEIAGTSERVRGFITALSSFEIIQIARTGRTAIHRSCTD